MSGKLQQNAYIHSSNWCLFLCVVWCYLLKKKNQKLNQNQVFISTLKIKSSTRKFCIEWHYISDVPKAPQDRIQLLFVSHHLFQSTCVKFCPTQPQEQLSGVGLMPRAQTFSLGVVLTRVNPKFPQILGHPSSALEELQGLNQSTPGLFRDVPLMHSWSGWL